SVLLVGLFAVRLGAYLSTGATVVTYDSKRPSFPHSTATCSTIGGSWSQFGGGHYYCDLSTKDSGRICRSAGDCQGACLANAQSDRTGRCSAKLVIYGCHPEVELSETFMACRD